MATQHSHPLWTGCFSSSLRRALVWGGGVLWVLGLFGCTPKLYLNETYRKALTVPVVDGTIALDNGIQIEVRELLKKENASPAKVWVTRLMGRYLLVAEGFKQVWMLRPSGSNQARYYALPVPQAGALQGLQLQHSSQHGCVKLITGEGAGQQWFIHSSGRIASRCSEKTNDG